MDKSGLILFGHGSRDPRWAEPFHRLRELLQQSRPEVSVQLAFLELMQPDLSLAVQELSDQGIRTIRIVPVFLGQGGHVRRDLPTLCEDLAQQFPELDIRLAAAVGESPQVLQAIAAYCVAQLD